MQDTFSIKIKQLLFIWQKPRSAITLFLNKETRFTHLRITIFLAFFYFFQLSALLWSVHLLSDISSFFTLEGSEWLVWLFIGLVAAITVILSVFSLVLFSFAKSLGGVGTFSQTRTAVYWSSMTTLPISFFFLLFIGFGKINLMAHAQGSSRPIYSVILQSASAIGLLISLIYGVIVFSKMVSELHRISIWRALASSLLGLSVSLILVVIILKIATNSL